MANLSVGLWSVVGGRWVSGGPVGGSVVSSLSVVSGFIIRLLRKKT